MAQLCLGTVQLGLDYGINNGTGRPAADQAFDILDKAYESGIEMLDTGPMYGNAEDLIGKYFSARKRYFNVCTKLPDVIPDEKDISRDMVKRMITDSLDRLRIERVYCYYLHQYRQCRYKNLMSALAYIKEKGFAQNIGISIYHPDELDHICGNLSGYVDAVQIPYNIFSCNMWSEVLEKACEKGITIFARSIFLQGLAFLHPDSDFAVSIGAGKYIEYVQELAKERDQKIEQVCYDAAASNPRISYIVLGCETLTQLQSDLELETNHKMFSSGESERAAAFMKTIPKGVLDPTTWRK